jgi:hypothetical protein
MYNPDATRRVVSSRNVVFDEAAVLSMGESNAEQRNDDEEDSIPRNDDEGPDTPPRESPLRESLQHSGSIEDERDMHSGEISRPRYNIRSTASPQQLRTQFKVQSPFNESSGRWMDCEKYRGY